LEKVTQSEKIFLNQSRIKGDFTKSGHRRTAIIDILLSIFLILFFVASILIFDSLLGTIILLLVNIVWLFLTIVKVKYVVGIYSNINKGNFKIKEDEVVSLNSRIPYRDSNEVISFRFKKYKKLIYEDKREYHDTQIGDMFYLVFVKGENEPIKVYNAKNCIIENGK